MTCEVNACRKLSLYFPQIILYAPLNVVYNLISNTKTLHFNKVKITLLLTLFPFLLSSQLQQEKLRIKELIQQNEMKLKETAEDITILKKLGLLYHDLGALGEKSVAKKATEYLEKYQKMVSKQDYEVMAYLGSCYTILGRDESIPFLKLLHVKNGCQLIDKAIKEAPQNVTVRMVRIGNSLELPPFFNRLKYAEIDCKFLLNSHEKGKIILSKEVLSQVYYSMGEIYYRKKYFTKAKECWLKVQDIMPDSEISFKANKKILQLK